MQKTRAKMPEIKLVGITVRTNNKAEFDTATAKIGSCVQHYFHQQVADKIPHRKNPGTTFSVFTDYESDYTGEYTYFIGEEVSSIDDTPEGLESHSIPPQTYIKFTTEPGPMPNVVIDAWQEIWKMSPEDLGGQRRYHTDFEIYDERANDPQNVVLDLYIGLEA
jgi:predicted transcriptional regulator YdeE